uniref:RNA helicase n=2 Tax=Amphimedon queenslandica TaxID=400682 RepID=A0A1X7TXT8_AMPQE
MLYKPNQEFMINQVERRARISVQRVGAPQSSDIVKASGDDAIKCVESVSDSVLCHFKEAAEKLIEEKGPENALCAALAYITGFTELTARSLLTSEKGYTTFMFSGEQEVRSPGYFWNIVERLFGEEARRSVRGMRLCSDNKSVVFDLPSNTAKQFESSCGTSKGITVSIPQTLPELKPRPNEFYQRQQQQSRNGRWSFGRGGGGGGSGRGRGNWRTSRK